MNLTLDTTFFSLHYFSRRSEELSKTRKVLVECRKLGGHGTVPTVVLAEFFALAHRTAGREFGERTFREINESGLHIVDLDAALARQAGVLRRKYQEKIPWGDCIIAATAILMGSDSILSEDAHFKLFKEVKTQKLAELVV